MGLVPMPDIVGGTTNTENRRIEGRHIGNAYGGLADTMKDTGRLTRCLVLMMKVTRSGADGNCDKSGWGCHVHPPSPCRDYTAASMDGEHLRVVPIATGGFNHL